MTRSTRPVPRALRRLPRVLVIALVAIAVALPLAIVEPAAAQSRREVLPGPITGRDVDEWARLLELSPQQRLGLDAAHARYLDRYRVLQDESFDPFTAEATRSIQGMFLAPDPDRIREILRDFDRMRRMARQADARFFADVAGLLGPDQAEQLPRIEDRRERDRMRTGFVRLVGFANDAARADLSPVLDVLDFAPAEEAAIEPIVRDYERRLTGMLGDVEQRSEKALVEIVEALADEIAAGLNLAAGDREAVFNRLFPKVTDAADPVLDEANRIAGLHRRAVRDMSALLPEESADRVRTVWWALVYDDIQDEVDGALRPFDRVLALPALPEELRVQVEAARADLRRRMLEMGDEATRLLDRVRTRPEIFGREREGTAALEEQAETLEERMDETADEARAALVRLVGEERIAEADEADVEERLSGRMVQRFFRDRMRDETGGRERRGGTPAGPPTPASPDGPDAWIAGPIDPDELARGLAWVGADETAIEVARGLHDDYRVQWDELDETLFAELAEAARDARPRGRRSEVDLDAIARAEALRAEAETAIDAIEADFLAQVEVTCIPPGDAAAAARFDRLVRARDRDRMLVEGASDGGRFGGWGARLAADHADEASIDLLRTVLALELEPALRDETTALLVDWERSADDLAIQHRVAAVAYRDATNEGWRRFAELRAEADEGDRRGGWRVWRDAFSSMQAPGEELGDSVRQLVAAHRSGLATLLRQLPETPRRTLRSAYLRQARPSVYRDGESAQSLLERAMQLDELSAPQREQVLELMLSYRIAWDDASNAIAEFEQAQFDPTAREGGPEWSRWQRRGEGRRTVDRLRQDRRELSDRTVRRLEAILGPALAPRLGLGRIEGP